MIIIEHTHTDGSLVHGTSRVDGTGQVIASTGDGWRFSRSIGASGAWYLPRTRDHNADRSRLDRLADALRTAGFTVQVRVDDTRRDPAAIEVDRAERVAGRARRYMELADARQHRGQDRLDLVRQRRAAIPLGQPVINDRYAGFLRRLNRFEDIARTDLATGEHWQRRAHAAESTQQNRHSPRVITRRIQRLHAERRRWQRHLDASTQEPSRARATSEIERLNAEIEFWQRELATLQAAGVYAAWTRQHFRVGDEVRIGGTWYPVLRVNSKSVTVSPLVLQGERRHNPDGSDGWTDRAPYDTVYGRRRAGTVLHTPPPPPGTVCTERIVIPTYNAEFVPQADGGPCPEPAIARVSIRHDGDSCGCNGRCLVTDPDHPDHALAQPWTETLLWCPTHDREYRQHLTAAGSTATYEVWT